MRIVIVGGGKVGAHLAKTLIEDEHDTTVVEMNAERCEWLNEKLPQLKVVCGDGDEPYILDEAGVRGADAVVAATGDDEDNLVVCLLCKLEYQVETTVARINNPANAWLFTARFGVDVPVSNTAIMTEVLKKVSLGDIVTLLRLQSENMVIDELVLTEEAAAVGKRISELSLPACGQIMAIVSGGNVIVPRGDTVLNAGDELLLLAKCDEDEGLRAAFGLKG